MYCQYCGANVPEGKKFCIKCGKQLYEPENILNSEPVQTEEDDKALQPAEDVFVKKESIGKKIRRFVIKTVLLLILFIALLIGAAIALTTYEVVEVSVIENCLDAVGLIVEDDEENHLDDSETLEEDLGGNKIRFHGIVIQPEDVVLKLFDSLEKGDYKRAAKCFDPVTERQIGFWGGLGDSAVNLFTGGQESLGELMVGLTDSAGVEVIECRPMNMVMDSEIELFEELVPKMVGIRNLFCTEADVCVKYRYTYEGEYRVEEEIFHVKRYGWSGWRVEIDY